MSGSLLAPALSALLLGWLAASRFSRVALLVSPFVVPAIVWWAPSPLELALTMATEAPIVWALAVAFRQPAWRAGLLSLFINGLTQPLLHLALTASWASTVAAWRMGVAVGEAVVWLAEALLYLACLSDLRRAKAGIAKALVMSLAANAASAGLGLVLSV